MLQMLQLLISPNNQFMHMHNYVLVDDYKEFNEVI